MLQYSLCSGGRLRTGVVVAMHVCLPPERPEDFIMFCFRDAGRKTLDIVQSRSVILSFKTRGRALLIQIFQRVFIEMFVWVYISYPQNTSALINVRKTCPE